jgi:hypothetical protein
LNNDSVAALNAAGSGAAATAGTLGLAAGAAAIFRGAAGAGRAGAAGFAVGVTGACRAAVAGACDFMPTTADRTTTAVPRMRLLSFT